VIIKYNETFKDARILARSGDIMRIALEDGDDAVELRLVDGIWLSEERRPVSFGFLLRHEIPLVLTDSVATPPSELLGSDGVSYALRC